MLHNTGTDAKTLARKIRLHALRMTSLGGTSHIGSVFSNADVMPVLYAEVLRVGPSHPAWPKRDRFILSKGHAGAGVYAALAERHNVDGGLGGAIAEYGLETGLRPQLFRRLGLRNEFATVVGAQEYLQERYHVGTDAISACVRSLLESRPK